jgi:hypothetical protein
MYYLEEGGMEADGFRYYDYSDALDDGLVQVDGSGVAYMNVDISDPTTPLAVKITSKQEFTHGLFIANLYSTPGGFCGISTSCKCKHQNLNTWTCAKEK